jgi:hypothetical protein
MRKPSSRPADLAVKDRERGAFAGDAAQRATGERRARSKNPRGPPYDIEVSDYDADTIPVFCKKNRISVAFYYKLKAQGKTPREMHLGNRRLITREAAARWRAEREAASTADA